MWLPETACDLESLSLLARHGIRFIILSPYQARLSRRIGTDEWEDVQEGKIDPSRAYLQRLPGGLEIAVFFYNGQISKAVAFERLLADGQDFAERLLGALPNDRQDPQLVHIATDGESYGHHHRFGDMALAFALDYIEQKGAADIINYGAFLERHPPRHEVQILENTSWSCAHGVERWRSDCGCRTGGQPEWHQGWRAPLRQAFDWLRDRLAEIFVEEGRKVLADPWLARDRYIEVLLDRGQERVDRFLSRQLVAERSESADVRALQLLEMQRHAMLMYTSCGWFFDELSGIETVQVIQYAGRAIQLAGLLTGNSLEEGLLARLELARSNLPEKKDGRSIYNQAVKPAQLDLVKVGSHYAVSTLFEQYNKTVPIYCYEIREEAHESLASGATRLSLGRAVVRSLVTRELAPIEYTALHLGGHNIAGAARAAMGGDAYDRLRRDAREAFELSEISELVKLVDRHFGSNTFSLRTLFRDEQQKYIGRVLADVVAGAEDAYVRVYQNSAQVMRFLAGLGLSAPAPLAVAAERALNHLLLAEMQSEKLNVSNLRRLLEDVREAQVRLDAEALAYAYQVKLESLAQMWLGRPYDLACMQQLVDGAELSAALPFEVNLWQVQNTFGQIRKSHLLEVEKRAQAQDSAAARWLENFNALAGLLWMRLE
jgi:hypothetical protein